MKFELSDGKGPMFLEFELYGPLSTEDLSQIVDRFDDDASIQKISIEIAAENPETVILPELGTGISEQDGDMPTSTQLSANDEHPSAELDGEDQSQPTTTMEIEQLPRLQAGGDPFAIMRFLDSHDGWLRTTEIAETIPDAWDVSGNSLNSTLWNLTDRGLLDKRPYEQDNRQNEYQITDIGERALENAVERVDDLQPIE